MSSPTTGTNRRGRDPDIESLEDDGAEPKEGAEKATISEDDIFEVLHNRRRRQVIKYLRETDGVATVSELAEHLAAEENDTAVDQITSDERKSVYVSLYQNHLPMMHDTNVVEYEENRKTVQLRDAAAQLDSYLDDGEDSNAELVPLGVSLTIAVIVLLGAFQVGAFGLVPTSIWAMFGAAGLLGIAGFELYENESD